VDRNSLITIFPAGAEVLEGVNVLVTIPVFVGVSVAVAVFVGVPVSVAVLVDVMVAGGTPHKLSGEDKFCGLLGVMS
jgi:hypothetical protein